MMTVADDFTIINPRCCGMPFAMLDSMFTARKHSKKDWYCPNCGTSRVFTGKTEEEERRHKAEQRAKNAEQRAVSAQMEAAQYRTRYEDTRRSYRRMRHRIQNGVCPSCQRTFENLARHMATKHPRMSNGHKVVALRHTYGLTQLQLQEETDVSVNYISRFENGKPIPENSKERLLEWIDAGSDSDSDGDPA